jgi:hypothetical protein
VKGSGALPVKAVGEWWFAASAGLCGFASALLLLWAGGASLDFYLVGTVAAALLVPLFLTREPGWLAVAGTVAAGTAGVALCWAGTAVAGPMTGRELVDCSAVLAGVVAVEVCAVRFLVVAGANVTLAKATVVMCGLAWLTWPLWLTAAPPLCVRVHPLLGINGALASRLGIWTEQPVAYPLIALGQDVAYRLPPSPWPGVAVHVVAGLGLALLATAIRRLRHRGHLSR